jgi:hypothetical protein
LRNIGIPKYNIHGAYQNHYGGPVGGAIWDLYELLRDFDPTYVGCQYDIRHAVAEGGYVWKVGLKLIAPWVKCTVLKDFHWVKNDTAWLPVRKKELLPVQLKGKLIFAESIIEK